MNEPSARTFTGDFRRFFLRGLVVVLPSVLTLWIVVKAYQFVDNTIAAPINRGVRIALINTARVWSPLQDAFDPTQEAIDTEAATLREAGAAVPPLDELRAQMRHDNIRQWWPLTREEIEAGYPRRWSMDLIGLLVAIVAVYISGRLLGGFFGRRLYRRIEGFITTVPVFKQVYPSVKQVVDFLFSDDQLKFNRVVATQYPRKGIWAIGFMTGPTLQSIAKYAGDSVTVFIPSSPTPFTGYTITVKREELVELPISVEEALRFTVSAGVLVPDGEVDSGTKPRTKNASGLLPLPGDATDATASGPDEPARSEEDPTSTPEDASGPENGPPGAPPGSAKPNR